MFWKMRGTQLFVTNGINKNINGKNGYSFHFPSMPRLILFPFYYPEDKKNAYFWITKFVLLEKKSINWRICIFIK
jgi:hypothetical protein